MLDIKAKIKDLNWNQRPQKNREAIEILQNIPSEKMYLLIMPNGKECWENAALVLKKIGWPRIEVVLPELFNWLRDINWPGASIICELLKTIPIKILSNEVEGSIIRAARENDDIWISGIKYFMDLAQMNREIIVDENIWSIIDETENYLDKIETLEIEANRKRDVSEEIGILTKDHREKIVGYIEKLRIH